MAGINVVQARRNGGMDTVRLDTRCSSDGRNLKLSFWPRRAASKAVAPWRGLALGSLMLSSYCDYTSWTEVQGLMQHTRRLPRHGAWFIRRPPKRIKFRLPHRPTTYLPPNPIPC